MPHRPTYIIYLLLSILFLIASLDTAVLAQSTTDHLQSPFNTKQLKWLNKHGFESQNYDWQAPDVNLKLKRAITYRNISRISFAAWASSFVIGTGAAYVAVLESVGPDQAGGNQDKTFKTFYLASGILLTSTIVISIHAKNKTKQANRLRIQLGK